MQLIFEIHILSLPTLRKEEYSRNQIFKHISRKENFLKLEFRTVNEMLYLLNFLDSKSHIGIPPNHCQC